MKIIKPQYKILFPIGLEWKRFLELAEYCARISHRSEDKIGDGSAQRLLEFIVMNKGDFSVIEHTMLTVEAIVDRGVTHELVRHRIASYTQESTRFVNYEKKMPPAFIYPQVTVECKHCLAGNEPTQIFWEKGGAEPDGNGISRTWEHQRLQGRDGEIAPACAYDWDWLDAIDMSEKKYKALIKKGWRPQEARSVFPTGLAAKIATTCNWRNWRHLFIMRATKEAHPQVRQVYVPLFQELKANQYVGWLFADLEPGMSQAEAMKRMR